MTIYNERAKGDVQNMTNQHLTGYPSIDKPWLKYYTEAQINAPLPHMTAYEYLKRENANRLDHLAIDSEVGHFTYGALFDQIDATAAALWAMGIQKGKTVLSMFPVLPHESFLFYGVDAVGAAMGQVAPQYTPAEVCNFVQCIDADLFFVCDSILTPEMEKTVYNTTDVRHIITVNFAPLKNRDSRTITWDAFMAHGRGVTLPEIHRNPSTDVLFLASTGGSTGEPKRVMYSDDSFNLTVHQTLHSPLPYSVADKWLRMWPIFSGAASIANHHMPLCCGMISVLRNFKTSITEFPSILLTEKPNHLLIIPQIFDVMEHSDLLKNQNLSFIISAGCGGAGITAQFEERLNAFFREHHIDAFVGYAWGCTESATTGAIRTSHETTRIGSVGIPHVNAIVSAFDMESGFECAYDQEGELCICAPGMMLGYYDAPQMTKTVLRAHDDGTIWLHTGDLGWVDKNGFIYFKDRLTRMILISPNAKIYPSAIENEIAKISGVQDVVFCAVPNKSGDGFYTPVVFIVPHDATNIEVVKRQVEQFCKTQFSEDIRPKHVFIKEHFPLNNANKPNIFALEAEAKQAMEG